MALVSIAVSPLAQRRKVGQRLMQKFAARAYELGMRSLRLTVHPDNTVAHRLYESCGWQPVSSPAEDTLYCFRLLPEGIQSEIGL